MRLKMLYIYGSLLPQSKKDTQVRELRGCHLVEQMINRTGEEVNYINTIVNRLKKGSGPFKGPGRWHKVP